MKCKKISYNSYNRFDEVNTKVILGIIEREDEFFIKIKTARKRFTIAKQAILAIEDTDQKFYEVSS